MARTKAAKALLQNSALEDDRQEIARAEAKPVTKVEAVKAALNEGIDMPQDGVAYIAERFGIEIAPQHFSTTKSQLKKKEGLAEPAAKRGPKPKPRGAGVVEGYLAPPPKPPHAIDEPDLLEALETMKPLIAALGAEKVKRIVDLLG